MVADSSAQSLWESYCKSRDPKLREEIILRYAPLVKYAVGRLAIGLPGIMDADDLLSHGTVGLVEAVDRFDPQRGVKFETYAIRRIQGSIIDALRSLDMIPRSARRRARALENAFRELQNALGRFPTDEETARHLGMSMTSYHQALSEAGITVLSLDTLLHPTDNDDTLTLGDLLEDKQSPNPVYELEEKELKGILITALKKLAERERLIIALYYNEELTLKEIGQVLGVSESRVSQLHTRAILKLRSFMSSDGFPVGIRPASVIKHGLPARYPSPVVRVGSRTAAVVNIITTAEGGGQE